MHAQTWSERREDPTFAGKKLWVCETCCRRFNTEAKTQLVWLFVTKPED